MTAISGNYNLTGLTNSTSIIDIINFQQDITGGLFIGGICIVMFFVLVLLSTKKADFATSIMASSAAMLILSIFLRYAGLINMMFIYVFMILFALSALYLSFTNKSQSL